jgi:hemoglobin
MRHVGFHIDIAAHDAWLACMMAALNDLEMQEIHRIQLVSYIEMAAHSMVNQPS